MNLFSKVKGMFGNKTGNQVDERSFREIIASAGSDWVTGGLQIDAEVFQNVFALRAAMRDLWACNPYLAKYREQIAANVFGEAGIMLRSKVKETEDRVVHAPDEKWALIAHERKINRIREWAERKTGTRIEKYRAFQLADALDRSKSEHVIRGTAMVEVGAPDVYANQRIESWWSVLQRAENIDVRGRRDYNTLRGLRLWSAARDGGCWVRMIKDPSVNSFGFALQQINDEWVDYFYNVPDTGNGTTIRMGIEYPFTSWGIGKPIAYHFIDRIPRDWNTGARYGGSGSNSNAARKRIPAEQIIHYARTLDNESTRPAPWGVSMLGKVRQLDQYEIAEVVAARAEACKVGYLYSDVNPDGGMAGQTAPDPRKSMPSNALTPGSLYGLAWGVKVAFNDPKHPSGNFASFRQGMGQSVSAALPGADYNIIFNDLANINFSAGRLGRLDTNEINKMLQRFDIETAERPIFENALEMALITGSIPFSYSKEKFKKLNQPMFQGRRWEQVDEGKAITAAAMRIANKLSSRNKECAERGIDFEDNAFELAEEDMLLEQLGLRQETTAQDPLPEPAPAETESADTETETSADATTAAETANIQATGLNGAQIAGLLAIVAQFTSGAISIESCNALIASSFPLMTPEEINAITANLVVAKTEADDAAQEPPGNVGGNTNGKHLPAIDKASRLALIP